MSCDFPIKVPGVSFPVPCGKCPGCCYDYSTMWAYRCMAEAKQYSHNCMITLTYRNIDLPKDNSISKREFQLFMKRLRKAISPKRIRFFGCGEYGEKRGRPHYHIILFDMLFDDMYFWKHLNGINYYRSPFLEKIWTKGFSLIESINLRACKYCAVYLQKFARYYDGRQEKPFVLMSRKPAIGANIYNELDFANDKIYIEGQYIKIPKYYIDKARELGDFDKVIAITNKRLFYGEYMARICPPKDNSLEHVKRLQAKYLNNKKL